MITASWTNIVSPGTIYNTLSRPQGLDWFGNGSSTSGPISSALAKTPGGVSGHVYGGGISDGGVIVRQGYPTGAVGYTQMVSWLYDTRFPNTIPGVSASTPFISANYWRGAGAVYFNSINSLTVAYNGLFSQWAQDVATKSTFSGTIASNVLTLTSAATGPMWEGEVIGGAGVTPGAYILNLASGSWGASGSTYNLGDSPANIGTATAMQNAVYYLGPGPAFYAGPMNDNVVQASNLAATTGYSPHPSSGFTGGRRIGNRLAALTWGGLTNPSNASDPTLSRAADRGLRRLRDCKPVLRCRQHLCGVGERDHLRLDRDLYGRPARTCAAVRRRTGPKLHRLHERACDHRRISAADTIHRLRRRPDWQHFHHHRQRFARCLDHRDGDGRLLGHGGDRIELHRRLDPDQHRRHLRNGRGARHLWGE